MLTINNNVFCLQDFASLYPTVQNQTISRLQKFLTTTESVDYWTKFNPTNHTNVEALPSNIKQGSYNQEVVGGDTKPWTAGNHRPPPRRHRPPPKARRPPPPSHHRRPPPKRRSPPPVSAFELPPINSPSPQINQPQPTLSPPRFFPTPPAASLPPVTNPASSLPPGKDKYAAALNLSWKYYQAQRAGNIPPGYPVPWVTSSLLTDPVQPGWYNAEDTMKVNFPLSSAASYLAWGLVEFRDAYIATNQFTTAHSTLRVAVDYLLNSYNGSYSYIGQIGNPGVANQFWGRPSDYPAKALHRPALVWTQTTPAADLLGSVAAALASASVAYRDIDAAYSMTLRTKAAELWQWGTTSEGVYQSAVPGAKAYPSADWADHMVWGAAWLYRATRDMKYLTAAQAYWGRSEADPYPTWGSAWGPSAAMLLSLADSGIKVPGVGTYRKWFSSVFLRAWLQADGFWSIVSTPKGMVYPDWSKSDNLHMATTAAMIAIMHAKTNPDPIQRSGEIEFARKQVDYVLGSTGRSFVVGYGSKYPLQPLHAGASCPDVPKPCDWPQFSIDSPNPQVLYGALVGGPGGKLRNAIDPDDSYIDKRSEVDGNKPSVDGNAGFTTALIGLWQLT